MFFICNYRILNLINSFVCLFVFFTAVAPMRMHMPMSNLALMKAFTDDEDETTKTPMAVGGNELA